MSSNLVCRTCLQVSTIETCKNIEGLENFTDVLEMLSYSIPEINMYLVIDPVICDNCVKMLRKVYQFKVQCLKIEENLLRYAQTIKQSQINLSEYRQRKITSIQPSHNCIDSMMEESTNSEESSNAITIQVDVHHRHYSQLSASIATTSHDCVNEPETTSDLSSIRRDYPKTAAQRMAEYRARKKKETPIVNHRKHKKSDAERAKEYRARKKGKIQSADSEKNTKKAYRPNNHKKTKTNSNPEGCYGCKINAKDPRYHQKTNYAPFICHYCEKQLDRIIDLRRHILGHVKQRQCKLCGKCFRDLTVLRRHLCTHTGEKAFACSLCPKKFQQKHCLSQHMSKHQGKEAIKCSYCQKLFSTKYNAKVHMKTMHKKAEICDLCGETFMSKPELVKHLETNSLSCGKMVNSEVETEEKMIETEQVKVEPVYMSVEDNYFAKTSKEFNENTDYKLKREIFINDDVLLNFPYKTEILDVNTSMPKQEEIVIS